MKSELRFFEFFDVRRILNFKLALKFTDFCLEAFKSQRTRLRPKFWSYFGCQGLWLCQNSSKQELGLRDEISSRTNENFRFDFGVPGKFTIRNVPNKPAHMQNRALGSCKVHQARARRVLLMPRGQ